MRFHAKYVSVGAFGDECFEVSFDSEDPGNDDLDLSGDENPYLIVQRQLEDGDGGAPRLEVARGGQPGEPRADDHDVRHRSSTVCSGSQPSCTREPGVQRSPVLIRGRFCSSTVRVTSGATSTRYCVVAPW